MEKMISVLLCLVMLFSVLPQCFAENDAFVFRNNISWGMSVDEVKEHELPLESEEFSSTGSNNVYLGYKDIPVSHYPKANLFYMFKDGMLYGAIYTFDNANDQTLGYILNALSSKYGEAGKIGYTGIVKIMLYLYDLAIQTIGIESSDWFDPNNVDESLGVTENNRDSLSVPGSTWELPDGTMIIYPDKSISGIPLLLYFAPEQDDFNTGGL